jgi:Bacterial extracellular solute-binding protein
MSDDSKMNVLGRLVLIAFVIGCFYGAYYYFFKKAPASSTTTNRGTSTPSSASSGDKVEIGIAYGTEKKLWLEAAVDAFSRTDDGKGISINLIPMGSLEGAQALLSGDQRIDVWSPASAVYKDVFVQDWQVKYGGNPIAHEDALALTPMVFVMWEERYNEFVQKYKTVSFNTIGQALQEKGGWDAIAHKPEWGLFKFGHTHPNESNSGLVTLILMAYQYHQKSRDLVLKDILDVGFQDWMQTFEKGVSGLPNSTGNLMREMILKGPSSFDAVLVYESVAIDYLKSAEGRWGPLRLIYPQFNMWNENPYYIINANWVTSDRRKAAEKFLSFLLRDDIQKNSLAHGFRPGNPTVPIKFSGSPFVQYASFGLKIDLGTICEPPKAEVINNLLESWQRGQK